MAATTPGQAAYGAPTAVRTPLTPHSTDPVDDPAILNPHLLRHLRKAITALHLPLTPAQIDQAARVVLHAHWPTMLDLIRRASQAERDDRATSELYEEERARAARAEAALTQAREIITDLTDPDPCWYDHHGYCQAHGWFATEPACPHARAKALDTPHPTEETR
jgi:hypothetical protein